MAAILPRPQCVKMVFLAPINPLSIFPGIYMKHRWYNHLRHTTTEKYDNNRKDGYFRSDDDNKMSNKHIHLIT